MKEEQSREIVVAPSAALTVASRLAERTLAARAARAALAPSGTAPTEFATVGGRTFVVGADGGAAYPTIGSAVAEARDGDRILVRPGRYCESVLVSRSVEIIGDGDVESIVVESDDSPCFVLTGATDRLARLTLRAAELTRAVSAQVSGGSAVLEELVLAEGHGVWVEEGASLTIRSSLIRDCGVGVFVRDGASATIENNEIVGSEDYGILISGPGPGPVIRRNKIHNYRAGGIYVHDREGGSIDHNEIFGNSGFTGHAISVSRTGSALVLRKNRIYDCGTGSGIRVDDASPTIEENEVFGNDRVERTINAGIMIWSASSAPMIRGNRVHDWPGDGIALELGASGTIEANEIFGNAGSGIHASKAGAAPVIRGNSIHNGHGFGIWVTDGAAGTIEANEIFGNARSGIMVSGRQTEPTIRGNRIHDNLSCGIQVRVGAAGSIIDNRVIRNRSTPIIIDPGASPYLARNVVG